MVYEYTKPRMPIAAMYASPGPCYGLPSLVGRTTHDPRSVHFRSPAYAFGIRHGKMTDDCSPGPCHLPEQKIYRDGRDGTPHYSLYSRRSGPSPFKTPGPGAHSPEKSGPSAYYRAPAYTFRPRTKLRQTDGAPAPNAYSLDAMLGRTVRSSKRQAPQFSMTGRSKVGSFYEDHAKTPGPANYTTSNPDTYKLKAPTYSMIARNVMPGDSCLKPGPGAHSPERVYINKRQMPSFSFGIRHSVYEAPLIIDPVQ
ncbi:hypothetical protein NP493_123g07010 [Ridgeia piscesae]|uniref:Outer dense fiber protein 3 n=1 Tax=Ridgeia piscesae TaxID=27915 RepID=A0AAD9P614_RIDPI|nr:hypothetical protein NP493_123g07010 [Ridgeia piscesae]